MWEDSLLSYLLGFFCAALIKIMQHKNVVAELRIGPFVYSINNSASHAFLGGLCTSMTNYEKNLSGTQQS